MKIINTEMFEKFEFTAKKAFFLTEFVADAINNCEYIFSKLIPNN